MKKCPFCLGEAWHVEGNLWECTMCGREFEAKPEAAPEEQSKNDNLKKGGEEMGKPGQPWSEEQRKNYLETIKNKKAAQTGGPLALTAEQRAERKRERDREYQRKKAAEKGNGSMGAKAKRKYRRRSPVDLSPAASPMPIPAKLKIFCMKCGFRMELENPDLLHTTEAP